MSLKVYKIYQINPIRFLHTLQILKSNHVNFDKIYMHTILESLLRWVPLTKNNCLLRRLIREMQGEYRMLRK